MNNLRSEEDEARRFFEVLGLTVRPIPTSSARAPDLQVDGDGGGYLVEVKRRTDTDAFARALQTLGSGEQTRPLGFDPRLFEAIEDAHNQMRQFDPTHQRLWIVWLSVDLHAGGDVGLQIVVSTLYGVKQAIMPAENGDGAVSMDCYYALPGAFERWPDLDAAIVSVPEGFCACANEFSSRAAEIVASRFARRLAERKALVVPTQREAAGECLVASVRVDRRSEAAVVEDLRCRYRRPVVCLAQPSHYAAFTHVQR